MATACEVSAAVFSSASAILLARVVNAQGLPLVPSQIASASYTVYQLDEWDLASATPLPGHTNRALVPGEILLDTLQLDALWNVDTTGYNFRHVVDVSSQPAFPVAGVHYRCRHELVPTAGQVIVVRFKLLAI